MDEQFQIQNMMATGKTHATYGAEYYVKFVDNQDTFKLWFNGEKKPIPKEGDKIEGHIDGNNFKKKKQEYTAKTDSGATPKRTYGAITADRNDGQRQGMAINNAAEYVNTHSTGIEQPEIWAKTVASYAKALYNVSDLNQVVEAETTSEVFKDAK